MAYEDQYQRSLEQKYDCLLFDVDDTLYPLSSGLSKECAKNIQGYMVQKLGIAEDKVPDLNRVLYKDYGTSMAGLKAIGYDFDNDDYHSFVHWSLPYDNLRPDHVLRSLLLSLPIRKVIFSNADKFHVATVLKRLGLEDCFDGVICFETLNPGNKTELAEAETSTANYTSAAEILDIYDHLCRGDASSVELPKTPVLCKPFEDAFEQAFKLANINPQKTVFFDDSIRNIQAGKRMGLHTVLVGTPNRVPGADYALESIHNIKEALPELWNAADNNESESRSYAGKIAIETSVFA